MKISKNAAAVLAVVLVITSGFFAYALLNPNESKQVGSMNHGSSHSTISTVLGTDSSGNYLVNADITNQALVNTTISVSSASLVEYVVIGVKLVTSSSFYDWGRATPTNSNVN